MSSDTRIALTQWEILAAMRACHDKVAEGPEYAQIFAQASALVGSARAELYTQVA